MFHFKADGLNEGWQLFMACQCSEISKIKIANIFFSHKSRQKFTKNNTDITTKMMLESYLIKNSFVLLLLATISTSCKDQKRGFWNILPNTEKIPKWTPKNQKFENLSMTHTFYFDFEILLLEVWTLVP